MLTISGGRSRRRVRSTIFLAALAWALATVLAPAAGAAKPQGEPAPFGHACSAQDGVRFCPTHARRTCAELRRGAARRRRDAAAERQRPVPHDRDDARLGRQQERLRVEQPGRRRQRDVRLQQRLLRPARLRGASTTPRAAGAARAATQESRDRTRAAKKAGSGSPTSAMRRATPSTCWACSPTRSIAKPKRSASPGSPTAAARASSSPT